jgi:multiple antibiotic resistance protein
MLGPIKLLGPFAAATKDCNRIFRLRLATRASLFAAAAVTIAAALGQQMLDNFAIPVLVLQIAAGLILFLVALQAVMHQYDVTRPPDSTEPPTLAHAFSPLAFPTIVTPYGIAAVIILIALAPTIEIRLMVAGVVYFIGSKYFYAALRRLDVLTFLLCLLVIRSIDLAGEHRNDGGKRKQKEKVRLVITSRRPVRYSAHTF